MEESWLGREPGHSEDVFLGKYGISEERVLRPQGTLNLLLSLLILNKQPLPCLILSSSFCALFLEKWSSTMCQVPLNLGPSWSREMQNNAQERFPNSLPPQ